MGLRCESNDEETRASFATVATLVCHDNEAWGTIEPHCRRVTVAGL